MTEEKNNQDYLFFIKNVLEKEGMLNNNRELPYWGNIPILVSNLTCLYTIYKPEMKFLDLGCGIGNVLRYASNIGYDVKGVEFDKNLISYLSNYSYICKDIRELDVELFSEFDVIYSYRPLKDEFEQFMYKVINHMKPGSYVVTPRFTLKHNKIEPIILNSLYKIKDGNTNNK